MLYPKADQQKSLINVRISIDLRVVHYILANPKAKMTINNNSQFTSLFGGGEVVMGWGETPNPLLNFRMGTCPEKSVYRSLYRDSTPRPNGFEKKVQNFETF